MKQSTTRTWSFFNFLIFMFCLLGLGLNLSLHAETQQSSVSPERAQALRNDCNRHVEKCGQLGMAAYKDGDYDLAATLFRRGCDEGGILQDCNLLGFIEKLRGNVDEAEVRFLQACEGYHIGGCYNLAVILRDRNDMDDAKFLFEYVCLYDDLNKYGCYELGLIKYNEGETAEGLDLMQGACEKEYQIACDKIEELKN